MVMGPTHATSGAVAWLALASFGSGAGLMGSIAVSQTQSLPLLALGTFVASGAALAPDWDSHSSTAVNSFGVLGKGINRAGEVMSLAAYNATATKYDENKTNGHRTLFHTLVAAVGAGVATFLLTGLGGAVNLFGSEVTLGQVFALVILFIFTHLGLAGLFEKVIKSKRRKYGPYVMMAFSLLFTLGIAAALPTDHDYRWLGYAVSFGWLMHLLGDAITRMGVPLFWPLKIRGKRWYNTGIPGILRIKAGGTFEKVVLLPILSSAAILLILTAIPATRQLLASIL